MNGKLTLTALTMVTASVALASYLPNMTVYTTDQLALDNQVSVNYITGDCASMGSMGQVADLVVLNGNNQWYAKNVILGLGSKEKVFSIPELHLVSGGSIFVTSGTLRLTNKLWLESGGGTLSLTGSDSCLDLTGNISFGTIDLSDFSLLNGASMTGSSYNFNFGAGGTHEQYGRIDHAAVAVSIFAVGSGSSGNVMDISDSELTLGTSLNMGKGSYKPGSNRLTLTNTTVTSSTIGVGVTMSRNHLEIAGGSSVTADRMNVGYRGTGDILTNCLENSVLVTGEGTMLSLTGTNADNLNNPALRIGYYCSATNSMTVADGATVTIDGSIIIGQEGDSRGNTLLVDHANLYAMPTASNQRLAVGYAGWDNALIADNGSTVLIGSDTGYTVRFGQNGRIASRNGSTMSINASVDLNVGGASPVFEVDNGTLTFGSTITVTRAPVFELRGASPSLNLAAIYYNNTLTNVFVLGSTSLNSTRREGYMYNADTLWVNSSSGTKFIVRIEPGCPDGEFRLMTWENSNWVDVNLMNFFVIEAPSDYHAELHYKSKDFPGTGYGKYFTVSVKRDKPTTLLVR